MMILYFLSILENGVIMIDIHSHILPYIDDGAENVETALEMLKMARDASTTAIVLTPHSNLYENDKNLLFELNFVFEAFKKKIENEGIDIEVCLGGEVFANDDIVELAKNKELPTLNNSRFMLIEFDFYTELSYITKTVKALACLGYVPIVAHPERYECIKKLSKSSLSILNSGGLMQINKGSILGDFGSGAKLCANELLSYRLAQFVASDAHTTGYRNTDMELAFDIVCHEFDEDLATRLFKTNPLAVIKNEKLKILKPLLF